MISGLTELAATFGETVTEIHQLKIIYLKMFLHQYNNRKDVFLFAINILLYRYITIPHHTSRKLAWSRESLEPLLNCSLIWSFLQRIYYSHKKKVYYTIVSFGRYRPATQVLQERDAAFRVRASKAAHNPTSEVAL